MCMEPLLANIEANLEITPIKSADLNVDLPKELAYADDVSVISQNKTSSLLAVFNEYSRLTRLSGLELNADKTEIMQLNNSTKLGSPPKRFNIRYLAKDLETCKETKINGILFQQNEYSMKMAYVDSVVEKMYSILKKWSM